MNTSQEYQTLDEPVLTTILRDVKLIGTKLRYVLIPTSLPSLLTSPSSSSSQPQQSQPQAQQILRNWDLWGPLGLCLLLSSLLSTNASEGQTSLVFAWIFILIWFGAGVVTLNAQLLGGKISFFQAVSVLGYCIGPLVIASIICTFIRSYTVIRSMFVLIGIVWACRASIVFMSDVVTPNRKALALYPVILFYLLLGYMIYII